MKYDNEKVIKELKKLLLEKKLSVIIGAGFSKNASSLFLNWKELLKDMIVEMYGYFGKQTPKYQKIGITIREEDFWKEFIDEIVSEKGYLSIASEYERRAGYREVLDDYIDARTPFVKKVDETYYAFTNNKKKSKVDLSTHKLLLELEWNNVYTFNYDNLLDIAGQTDEHEKLEIDKKKLLSVKVTENEKKRKKINEKEELLAKLKELLREKDISNNHNEKDTIAFVSNQNDIRSFDEIEDEIIKLDKDIQEINIQQNNIEKQLLRISEKQKNMYHLVDDSSKISLRKEKNIIKLHGTIRCPESDMYGFDNDSHCNYIISTDDYDNYHVKHEAFVNLMRIALLQDSFCLIGFSGDDPNFLDWLSWVKDLLDRRAEKNKEEKIFFIDVSAQPLSNAKKTFFRNHYIKHIPLFDANENVSRELIKETIDKFLMALKPEKDKAVMSIKKYNQLWQDFDFNNDVNNDNLVLGLKREDVRDVWEVMEYNRLPKLESDYYDSKHRILYQITNIISKDNMDTDIEKLFIMALKGEFLPLDVIIDEDNLSILMKQVKTDEDIYTIIELLYIRSFNLFGKDISTIVNNNSDASIYESILSKAFALDFTSLYKHLSEWQPTDNHWVSVKFAFGKLFKMHSTDDVIKLLSISHNDNSQKYLLFLQTMQKVLLGKSPDEKNEEYIQDEIRKIQNPVLTNLYDNIKYLTDKLSKQKKDITPYGKIINTIFFDSTNSSLIHSVQLLQIFIEIGLPLHTLFVSFYNKEDWYRVFQNIYTRYPYPCLFYSLQYGSDEGFMERIAQDYAYSNKLKPICSDILIRMLRAYSMPKTPMNIKNGILSLSPQFFKFIPNSIWQMEFEKIYFSFDFSDRDINRSRINPFYNFVITGVEFSNSNKFKYKVLTEVLSKGIDIDNIDNLMIISAKKNINNSFAPPDYDVLIEKLLTQAQKTSHFFVLFNLYDTLSDKQQKKLIERILKFDFPNCNEPVMFEAASRFAKNIPDLSQKIEAGIKNSKLLWNNGIKFTDESGVQVSHPMNFINLRRIQENIFFKKGSIIEIYNKLKFSLSEILKAIQNQKSPIRFFDWEQLLLQMHLFLRENKAELQGESDYLHISQEVERLYLKEYGAKSIIDALISDDTSKVRSGIQNLLFDVDTFGIKEYTSEYLIIANRIVTKAEAGLNSCINHFSWAMYDNFKDIEKDIFKPFILKILEVYQPYFSDIDCLWNLKAKKEDVESAMIRLNSIAKKWRSGNKYWNKHKRVFYQ
jgi:hypothetical protein